MSDHTNRTKIVRPLNDSWPKSSPRPFLTRRSEVDSDTHCAVHKVLTRLMRLRVVKKQCEAFEMSGRTVGLDLLQPRSAIPNLPDMHRSIQIHPVVGTRKRMQEEAGTRALGIGCDPVIVKGEKEQFLDWLSWGVESGAIRFPADTGSVHWPSVNLQISSGQATSLRRGLDAPKNSRPEFATFGCRQHSR
jgi:hypothetical protein